MFNGDLGKKMYVTSLGAGQRNFISEVIVNFILETLEFVARRLYNPRTNDLVARRLYNPRINKDFGEIEGLERGPVV